MGIGSGFAVGIAVHRAEPAGESPRR